MQSSGKKVYLSIGVAVVVVLAAIVATTIYTSNNKTSRCQDSSTTTVYPAYNANVNVGNYVGLSMLPGCTAKLYLQFNPEASFTGSTNSTTYTLRLDNATILGGTYVGTWHQLKPGELGNLIHRIQNDTLNATVYPSTVTTSNHTGADFYFDSNFTVTISASNSTKGFYILALPGRTWVPLAVGYDVSQVNMTKDYPGFESIIGYFPILPGVAVRIMQISSAMSIGYVQ